MTTKRLPLRDLIDRDREQQNGFGYDEFVRMVSIKPKPPSKESLRRIYNKNYDTIRRWIKKYEQEEQESQQLAVREVYRLYR